MSKFFSFLFKKKKTNTPTQPQSQSASLIKTQTQGSNIKSSGSPIQNAPTGSSLGMKPQTFSDPVRQKIDQDNDQWIYEYVLQYLTSPLWRIPISQFIDENCLIFDNEETNQFAYTDAHNNFKSMIEKMLEELLKEINITEEKFMAQVEKGIKVEAHKRIFDQLLVVDNFLVFKRLMVKRNKELELEAMRALEQQELEKLQATTGVNAQAQNMERMKLETEKAQIDHAIAMSLAIEEEKKKMKDQEDMELQQVLKESELEYQRQQEKLKAGQIQNKPKEEIKSEEPKPKPLENPNPTPNLETTQKPEVKPEKPETKQLNPEEKKDEEEQQEKPISKTPEKSLTDSQFQKHFDQSTEVPVEEKKQSGKKKLEPVLEEQKDFVTLKENPKTFQEEEDGPLFHSKKKSSPPKKEMSMPKKEASHVSELPPLKPDMKYDPLSLNDLLKEKQNLAAKLDALKAKPSIVEELKAGQEKKSEKEEGESFMERKKRLEKQRELILKKKREEREKELKEYKETGAVKNEAETEKSKTQRPLLVQDSIDFSQNKDLLQKRSEIMKKFKETKDNE